MSGLQFKKWSDFKSDDIKLSKQEVIVLSAKLPQWQIIEECNIAKLQCKFEFENFESALVFTNDLGRLSESYHHHPQIILEWGRVTLTWWSHKLQGLHQNDFFMAKESELLYGVD